MAAVVVAAVALVPSHLGVEIWCLDMPNARRHAFLQDLISSAVKRQVDLGNAELQVTDVALGIFAALDTDAITLQNCKLRIHAFCSAHFGNNADDAAR